MNTIYLKAIKGEKVELSVENVKILVDALVEDACIDAVNADIAVRNGKCTRDILDFRNRDDDFSINEYNNMYLFFKNGCGNFLELYVNDNEQHRADADDRQVEMTQDGMIRAYGIVNLKVNEMFGVICPDGFEFSEDSNEDRVTLVRKKKTYEDYVADLFWKSSNGVRWGYLDGRHCEMTNRECELKEYSLTNEIEEKVQAFRIALNLAYAMNKNNDCETKYEIFNDVAIKYDTMKESFCSPLFKGEEQVERAIDILGEDVITILCSHPEL